MRMLRAGAVLLLALLTGGEMHAQMFGTYAGGGYANAPDTAMLKEVGIQQNLGAQLPLDARFRDEAGNEVRLGQYFDGRPVVLLFAYYGCPSLCTQMLNGLVRAARPIPMSIGKEFQVVTVSINPAESFTLAAEKKKSYVESYGRPEAPAGWHFLTGTKEEIDRVAQVAGFRYRYDEKSKQYAHGAGLMVATPKGELSRYFYGFDIASDDLRLGLVEASDGTIGRAVDQALLLCFQYDPTTGKYGASIMKILRLSGIVTVVGIVGFLGWSITRERRRSRAASNEAMATKHGYTH